MSRSQSCGLCLHESVAGINRSRDLQEQRISTMRTTLFQRLNLSSDRVDGFWSDIDTTDSVIPWPLETLDSSIHVPSVLQHHGLTHYYSMWTCTSTLRLPQNKQTPCAPVRGLNPERGVYSAHVIIRATGRFQLNGTGGCSAPIGQVRV